MVKFQSIIGKVALGLALIDSMAALADPVTDGDLRGKKIFWTTGTATYNKDGSFDSTRAGHGTWTLAGDQLTVLATNGAGASQITKDSGTFHTLRRGLHGKDFESWGHYCN